MFEHANGASARPDEAFRREVLSVRALPFLLVALTAAASLELSPGPASIPDYLISMGLLAVAVLCFFLPWKHLPPWLDVIVPLSYAASALFLVLAAGPSSGVGLVIFLPLVWTALYLQPWKSTVVVAALAVVQIIQTYMPVEVTDAVRLRKVLFFVVIGSLLAYSITELRTRMARSNAKSQNANLALTSTINQLVMISELADMLHSCTERSEAYEVIEHSAALMFPDGGSVAILNASKDHLETVAAWGDNPKDTPPFSPHDCWALRRGHVYESKPANLSCAHLSHVAAPQTLCRPLFGQGELIGVMNISLQADPDGSEFSAPIDGSIRQLLLTVAEQISSSMSNFQLRESLRDLSIRDPLTNLFNRRFMEETLNREVSGASRSDEELSVMQIDVDHFKTFNDVYGHEVGDAVLKAVGEVLLLLFRDSDVPCRSGGEEFTVVLPNCSWADAERRARDLQGCISELDFHYPAVGARPTPPTLSIGIATSPEHGRSSSALLRAADLALYEAKAAGRNRIAKAMDRASMSALERVE